MLKRLTLALLVALAGAVGIVRRCAAGVYNC
jgi:hypothetical protein